jgi:hypothetical protein
MTSDWISVFSIKHSDVASSEVRCGKNYDSERDHPFPK